MSLSSNIFNIERSSIPHNFSNDIYYTFFSKSNISYISKSITEKLNGVHPEGKNIIVPDKTIISVMDSIYYSTFRDIEKMKMMTISYIVDYIETEYETEKKNKQLSIWVTNYTNDSGLNRVPKIKLREKRPTPFLFNMNY